MMTDAELLERSRARREEALSIMGALGLLERWSAHGRPVLVGAVAHDLVWGPDIDLEVYCPALRVEDGFAVLAACSAVAVDGRYRVVGAEYGNFLQEADAALYWRLRILTHGGTEWKVDMWSADEGYSLPRGEHLVTPLRNAMTHEMRLAILRLKALREQGMAPDCLSIDLYRAVITDGVRTADELLAWMDGRALGVLTDWCPAM